MKMRVLITWALMSSAMAWGRAIVEEGYHVSDPAFLSLLRQQGDLTIDHVGRDGFEVFGPRGLGTYLHRVGIPAVSLETSLWQAEAYPTHEEITAELRALAARYPRTARLFSIGTSSQGRELWVMKISRNVGIDDGRPEFKYVANMHGDEIVGRELMVKLITDLLTSDGRDPIVTRLLDQVQIYIMPSLNPDGAQARTRGNGNSVDLNRDFPDFSTADNQNTLDGREPETMAMMRWQRQRRFRLSANFHGGAEVVNYPWDTVADTHPQVDLVKSLSLDYARLAPYIGASTVFENGITNGYAWYEVDGGMQDWSYHWHRDLQITIELSDEKYPDYSTVGSYYQQNRPALLNLIGKTLTFISY